MVPVQGLPINGNYYSPIGVVNISASIPEFPSTITAFRITPDSNDMVYYSVSDLVKTRTNVTSEVDAPIISQKILDKYGGLPPDAILNYVKTEYIYTYNFSTKQDIPTDTVSTNVQYARSLDGKPVVGDGAYINMELGDNGELLYLNKVWRTVTADGNLPIQSVSVAIDKLRTGEVINPKKDPYNVNVTKIRLGYFEKGMNQSEEYLEPAWLFKGTTESGDPIQYYVYARQFANFTTPETNISTFHAVNFNDTSETTPVQWLWDFGDGTNSTTQNPSHAYLTTGNYTVSLRAWNELGSDTETKTDYITVWYQKPINADFNATPTAATAGDDIQFYDASDSSPNKWYWDFGDGTNSTDQNPTHAYSAGGNYTVNLTAGNIYGNDTISRENAIFIFPSPAPVANFISNYSWSSTRTPVPIAFNDSSEGNITHWIWDFGDGTNSSEPSPVHVFTVLPGETYSLYEVNLTIVDNYGRTSSGFDYFEIKKGYYPDFNGTPREGFAPLNVTFHDLTPDSDTANRVVWDFGDGESFDVWRQPILATVLHKYVQPGTYDVTLTYYDELPPRLAATARTSADNYVGNEFEGYDDHSYYRTKESYIVVTEPAAPVAEFTANVTTGKDTLPVLFSDQSTGFPTAWNWSFGDGAFATDWDPEHLYSTVGNYTVSLTVNNAYGGDNTTVKKDYITVFPRSPPVATFIGTPPSGKVPLTVSFNDTSTGSPASWNWDFGDGSNATDQNPVHTYPTGGNYSISLTAQNADGTNSTIKIDYITVLPLVPPVADFIATPISGKTPLTVTFNDISTGSPDHWIWDFGEGSNATDQNPVHTYTRAGTYTVSLSVTNADGTDLKVRPDCIIVSTLTPPVVGFTTNSTSGKSPLAIAFTDTSTNSPTSWNWTFGDGAFSDEQNPVHVYSATGTYTVSLIVTNPDGSDTATRNGYISVSAPVLPVADFSSNRTTGNAPLTVGFTDSSTGQPTSWYWDFGDGKNSTGQNPVHQYISAGSFTVSLTVANPDGSNTKTRTNYITVTAISGPAANFTGHPTHGKAPLKVTFNDTSIGFPTQWYWSFGDGTNTTDQNPVHIYLATGKYTVSMTASNAGGSDMKTRKQYITITAPTPTPAPVPFYPVPTVNVSADKCNVRLDWNVITDSRLQGYKVVISKTNSNPKYPDDGYMYWITDRYHNYSVLDTKTPYNGGDIGGYLKPGQKYYFSITAVYTDAKVPGNSVEFVYPACGTPTPTTTTIKPTETCTVKPTTTCTIKPTVATTAEPPCAAPHVTGITGNSTIRLDWDAIMDSRLQAYKVVISKNNPNPKYPDDGYMYWITDRYQNYSVVDTRTSYNGGDIGVYLKPGQIYYFSIIAVYTNTNVSGNVIHLKFPGSGKSVT